MIVRYYPDCWCNEALALGCAVPTMRVVRCGTDEEAAEAFDDHHRNFDPRTLSSRGSQYWSIHGPGGHVLGWSR